MVRLGPVRHRRAIDDLTIITARHVEVILPTPCLRRSTHRPDTHSRRGDLA